MKRGLSILFASTLIASAAVDWSQYYTYEDIALPADVDQQVGGLIALADGRLAACFKSGEVKKYDPAKKNLGPFRPRPADPPRTA